MGCTGSANLLLLYLDQGRADAARAAPVPRRLVSWITSRSCHCRPQGDCAEESPCRAVAGHVVTGQDVVTEVVRMLVGDIGPVASVPITAALAALAASRESWETRLTVPGEFDRGVPYICGSAVSGCGLGSTVISRPRTPW
jgi:hypothetical protein